MQKLTHLNTQNAEYNEKRAANKNYIADRSERWKKSLHDELEARRSAYHSERTKSAQQAKHSQYAEYFGALFGAQANEHVNGGHNDQ